MTLPCLVDILNAVITGQKEGGPHGTLDLSYIVTGFYLQPFDLRSIGSHLDVPDVDLPRLEGALGPYRSVPVFPFGCAPNDPNGVGESHNVMFSFVRMTCLD
jgi:hypothetical protein